MKVAEHIDKAAEALADMVADGHLRDDFELAEVIYLAQYGLQEAKKLSAKSQEPPAATCRDLPRARRAGASTAGGHSTARKLTAKNRKRKNY